MEFSPEWWITDKQILLAAFYHFTCRIHFYLVFKRNPLRSACVREILCKEKLCLPSLHLFNIDSLRGSYHSLSISSLPQPCVFLLSLPTAVNLLREIGIQESVYSWWAITTLEICYEFMFSDFTGCLKNTKLSIFLKWIFKKASHSFQIAIFTSVFTLFFILLYIGEKCFC